MQKKEKGKEKKRRRALKKKTATQRSLEDDVKVPAVHASSVIRFIKRQQAEGAVRALHSHAHHHGSVKDCEGKIPKEQPCTVGPCCCSFLRSKYLRAPDECRRARPARLPRGQTRTPRARHHLPSRPWLVLFWKVPTNMHALHPSLENADEHATPPMFTTTICSLLGLMITQKSHVEKK